jgi:hypothetical protein
MAQTAQLVLFCAIPLLAAACAVDARSVSTPALGSAGSGGAAGASASTGVNEVPPGASGASGGSAAAGEGDVVLDLNGEDSAQTSPDGGAGPICEGAGCPPPTELPENITLSFSFDGAPSGQVTLTAGTTSQVCRESCSLLVPRGARVTLAALPAFGGTVTRWSDPSCGNEISCSLRADSDISVQVAIELGFNIMFSSRSRYTPIELPRAGAEANQHCASLAANAGLPGQRWVAWLGAEGPTTAVEDDIVPIELLQHTGGWVRTDGVILARSVAALARGEVLHRRDLDEARARPVDDAWIGVRVTGLLNRDGLGVAHDCNNWTSVAADAFGGISLNDGLGTAFAGVSITPCDRSLSILCFGDDSDKELPIVTPTPNRLAFLSSTLFTPGGGISAADAICQQDACAAGLTGGGDCSVSPGSTRTFKSYLHRAGQPAWQRFSPDAPDWVRPDGLLWLRAADLISDGVGKLTGLNVTLSLSYLTSFLVWVGDTSPAGNCQDWTSTAVEGMFNHANRDTGRSLSGFASTSCATGARLYCLEE